MHATRKKTEDGEAGVTLGAHLVMATTIDYLRAHILGGSTDGKRASLGPLRLGVVRHNVSLVLLR